MIIFEIRPVDYAAWSHANFIANAVAQIVEPKKQKYTSDHSIEGALF